MPDTEQIIDDFKTLITSGIVDCCNVGNLCKLCGCMTLQKLKYWYDTRRGNVDCQFVFPDRELLNISWEAGKEILSICVEAVGFVLVFVGWINYWGVKLFFGGSRSLLKTLLALCNDAGKLLSVWYP